MKHFRKRIPEKNLNIALMIAMLHAGRVARNYVFFVLGCFAGLISCTNSNTTIQAKKFRIGFSQCTGDNKWRRATLEGVKRELSFHPGTELIYKNAEDNSALQVKQIKELSAQNIDILLVSPNEAEPLTSIIEEIYNKGIPVVIIDRKINSDMYTAFVGADNVEIGRMAGNYVSNLLAPNSSVIEIIGLKGSTPSIERRDGFAESLKANPRVRLKAQIYGNWLKDKSEEELLRIKDLLSPTDIVFAQNDPMALGAYDIYKKLGMEKTARFIGVDALAGPGGGIDLVSEKKLKATLLNPTGGEEAIQIAFKILNKEQFNKENTLSTVVIDSTNVRIMKLQTDKINTQQKDIENQQEILLRQQKVYENQNTVINIFIGALLLVLTLTAISIYALWNNRKITRRLSMQNQEILNQRNQLIEMTARAKEATDAKFNFFTNISHEFRTPLTLILGPVEDCLHSSKLHFTLKPNLSLVHKNTMRLLRLINQLMDYRKIEESRMKLRVSENDLVPFVSEITDAFQVMAKQKSVSFKVNAKVKTLPLWFDVNMLDKVLFNLLSNAFKFTTDNGGVINVIIDKTDDNSMALIRVEDSGVGMHPEEIDHAFDLFYQGNTTNSKGTGLGLSLSRELVNLHHGKITLRSEKWKGTTFDVYLPLGNGHFEESDFTSSGESSSISYEDVKIYTKEAGQPVFNADYNPPVADKQHSILIIEDNDDLRLFLKGRLSDIYEVHEAENGKLGLNLAYDIVPDLIISDIILPGNDGMYITEMIKQDIRTSHIPLILLTAKNSIEEQIKGIRLQADAFIVKPFNLEYLTETIKNLLKSRALLREHYTSELPSEARSNSSKKIDRKFINEFTSIVESNVPNESFSVEEICKEIGISRVQLYRKVKALLDYNVNDYILTVRMQKAKYLLANESMSIFEVACKVGFSSQAYFATVFKSKFSVTPTEYRESKKN
jgi:signal transduction histidine kinase/DNA-binding response OmpR family regulator/cellobiose-specific phosphotransferase system component IIB